MSASPSTSSCGRCRRCLEGRPYICERSVTPRAAGQLLSGHHRLHLDGKPVNHQSGVSCYAEYAVVDRGSVVVIDKTPAARHGRAVRLRRRDRRRRGDQHRADPARQHGGRRRPGRRRPERPDRRGAGRRRPHRRHRPLRRQARPRPPARRHRHGERQGRRPREAGARPHQRRRRLCLRPRRHHQGDGDGLSGDALGRHDGDGGPVADRRRLLLQAERAGRARRRPSRAATWEAACRCATSRASSRSTSRASCRSTA